MHIIALQRKPLFSLIGAKERKRSFFFSQKAGKGRCASCCTLTCNSIGTCKQALARVLFSLLTHGNVKQTTAHHYPAKKASSFIDRCKRTKEIFLKKGARVVVLSRATLLARASKQALASVYTLFSHAHIRLHNRRRPLLQSLSDERSFINTTKISFQANKKATFLLPYSTLGYLCSP